MLTWDGQRLPGPWLVLRAMEIAIEKAKIYGSGTVTIGRSHHIACLAAYLKRATDQGLVMLLLSSAPGGASVAPHGGLRPVFSPSPIAIGFPAGDHPVLVDVSTSITTNMLTRRLHKEGKRLPQHWLIDENGEPSDDPAILQAPRRGTILPLGGLDAGHKGYGLALLVEALTAGLAGHGRADPAGTAGCQCVPADTGSGSIQRRRRLPPPDGMGRASLPGQSAAPGFRPRAPARADGPLAPGAAIARGRRPGSVDPAGADAVGAEIRRRPARRLVNAAPRRRLPIVERVDFRQAAPASRCNNA